MRSLFRRLPPVARRDARIRALTKRLDPPSAEPSFRAMVHSERRMAGLGRAGGTSVIKGGKFHVYDIARSHGLDVPEQLGRWSDPREIPWDELPDLVVIKSKHGTGARGVVPLRRVEGGWQVVDGDGKTTTGADVANLLLARVDAGRITGPFAAEEFLDEDGTGSHAPTDVKIYAFYGSAPLALLRSVVRHGDPRARIRVVDRDGHDLVGRYKGRPTDSTVGPPAQLAEMFEIAERLSVAIRAPFSRIDLYGIGDRIVFGEVTPRPGGPQWFGRKLDRSLGDAWERAHVRLSRDLAAGAPPDVQWGEAGRQE